MSWYNELPLVGGVLGGIFGNPEEEAHQKALKRAQQDMYAYRPEVMGARMNAMGSMSHAFEPINNLMGQAYGPGAQMDWSKMIQNPFSPEAIDRMNAKAHPQSRQGTGFPPGPPLGPDGRPLVNGAFPNPRVHPDGSPKQSWER